MPTERACTSGSIQIDDSEWEWDNEARNRGLATITVNRLPMQLEAIEVAGRNADGTGWAEMKAVDPEYREQLDFVYLVGCADVERPSEDSSHLPAGSRHSQSSPQRGAKRGA